MKHLNLKLILLLTLLFMTIPITAYSSPLSFLPASPSYDVIVIGSDPEGISAAVTSSRNGSSVLMIDTRSYLGGLYTSGMLSMLDMNYVSSNGYKPVNEGFFKEFYDSVAVNANIDIEKTKKYFTNLLFRENVSTVLNASLITPIKNENNEVIGVSYFKDGTRQNIRGKVFIDASIDAKFARSAGAPYKVGREELGMKNEYAAATLVFSLQGVDWSKVKSHLNLDKSIYTGANDKVAWGYPNMLNYTSSSKQFQLRSLNLSLQDDGSVAINAFQIFNTDSLDEQNIWENYDKAVNELPNVVEFIRKNAVGFENAWLHKYADELYIREGVRIVGEYTLTGEDVFNNINFSNKIAYGSYPMDLQATKRDFSGGTILTARNIYSIPITIMVPKLVDNLLVVGRSASYDPLSHSSARTVPVGMALGQAAGVLASYSIDHSLPVRTCSLDDFHVRNIQQKLRASGVVLDTPLNTWHPERSSWAYPYMVELRKKAFLSMEYQFKNDYRCKEPATFETVSKILTLIRANSSIRLNTANNSSSTSATLTNARMVTIFNQLVGTNHKTVTDLYNAHLIDEVTFQRIKNKSTLLNEDIYAMMYGLVQYAALSTP